MVDLCAAVERLAVRVMRMVVAGMVMRMVVQVAVTMSRSRRLLAARRDAIIT